MRFGLVALAAACAPVEGSIFDAAEPALGERPLVEHAWVGFVVPAAGEVELESSDPAVIDLAAAPPTDTVAFEGDRALWWDEDGLHVLLETGTAGEATLSAWVDGAFAGELEVVVTRPAFTRLAPPNAEVYDALAGLAPRQLAGSRYAWRVDLLDAAGEPLGGFPLPPEVVVPADELPLLFDLMGGRPRVAVEAGGPGLQPLAPEAAAWVGPATVEVVAPEDVERIELWPSTGPDGASALVAVGIDRAGEPVLGLPGTWSEGGTGDVYRWLEDLAGPEREITVTWGEHVATARVRGGPGSVASTDAPAGCSTTGTAPTGALALLALLGLRRRR